MKLKTLIEYQRCYDMLREAESSGIKLSGKQYIECVRAEGMFNTELERHVESLSDVPVTDWSAA